MGIVPHVSRGHGVVPGQRHVESTQLVGVGLLFGREGSLVGSDSPSGARFVLQCRWSPSLSQHDHPAIDRHGLAGDETRHLAREEDEYGGSVVIRVAELSAERNRSLHLSVMGGELLPG